MVTCNRHYCEYFHCCDASGGGLQALNTEGWVDPNSKSKKPRKNIDFSLHSLWGLGADPVIQPEVFTASGTPLYDPHVAPHL